MKGSITILLPTDFSESARNAMRYGLQLYKGRGCNFIMLNSVEPTTSSSSAGMIMNMSEILTKDSLEGLKKDKEWIEALPEAEGCSVETVQMFGEFLGCVNHIIKDRSIDMVIMGTTGASGLKEFFVGSNAASVILDVNLPTLTVPFNAKFEGISKIVFATDFNLFKSLDHLQFLKEIAIRREAQLTLLHVTKSSSKISEENKAKSRDHLLKYFEDCSVNVEYSKNDDTVEGIQAYMRKNTDADILAMVPRKKNFFEKIFSKSVAKKVAYHSRVPMLTLQQH
ncbi:MAG: hypothetical protein CL840_17970 [Crocinitomicaceae bacterium]|nr:hypothetical protein [Crocinitomicaceae bacterium]|tara:strand:- start:18821 stop:19666 length:846 start_codon:yes stop_codon:yes gene_type:complete